eukprot:TRINITY_DN2858_c0_g1_i3.p1 TRINITY_DN2858_c0_g1~~TRINITY_DN2858_c0_g1_i3.p1  ORF type:complete len:122 (-),score=2.74 TRINITY_DN2858_c0_g1_i3:204-569(-)
MDRDRGQNFKEQSYLRKRNMWSLRRFLHIAEMGLHFLLAWKEITNDSTSLHTFFQDRCVQPRFKLTSFRNLKHLERSATVGDQAVSLSPMNCASPTQMVARNLNFPAEFTNLQTNEKSSCF